MAKINKINGLIIPGDSPPKLSSLKRQVLFFDSVSLVHPDDKAVVNEGELIEKFPNMEINWEDYACYPRTEGYQEEYQRIICDTGIVQKRGIVRIISPKTKSSDDAGANFMLYNSALSNEKLILSSVPDISDKSPDLKVPEGRISGGGMEQTGYTSKYSLDVKPPYIIKNATDLWNCLASLRTGRTIKALRRAHLEGCCPIALDAVSNNILESIALQDTKDVYKGSDYVASVSISLDILDPIELEMALENLSWNDVMSIRREIFPKISDFRHYVVNRVGRLNRYGVNDYQIMREEIEKLRADFLHKKESLTEAWEKLRIASVMKFGGGVGVGNIGLSLLPASISWIDLLTKIVCVGLVSASALTPELKELIPAKRKVKNHPLFFLNELDKIKSRQS